MTEKVYVVERQSQYDGGYTIAVFSSEEKVRSFIEKQKDFKGWDDANSTKNPSDDFYYTYYVFEIDKEEE